MLSKKLYRGDRAGNTTKPELYRSEGLITKLINNGNSAYINNVGLFEAVRAHVKPESLNEKIFLTTSSFLSFLSNEKVALYYASDGNSENLISSKEYFETRYLFKLLTTEDKVIALDKGLYKYEYECKRNLISPNSPSQIEIYELRNYPCDFCNYGQVKHSLLLIDVVEFLKVNPNFSKYRNAIDNAQTDSEWLVLPLDFDFKLHGYRARIPHSFIWKADHFILKSENPRDPELFATQGILENEF